MSLELVQEPVKTATPSVGVTVGQRRDIATRFQPGNPGNPGGRPRSAKIRRHLLRQLNQEVAAGVDRLDCALDSIIEKTIREVDVSAATFIRDTVDGKPSANDRDSGPTNIMIEIAMVGGQ